VRFKTVPHTSTFSRAFARPSSTRVFDLSLEALVRDAHKDLIVYHVCRDSAAIPAREKPQKKTVGKPTKPGRPAQNTPQPVQEPAVLEKQVHQTPAPSLAGINKTCAWSSKKQRGAIETWKGYTLHLDLSGTGFPLTARPLFDPAKKDRYKIRTAAGCTNSDLKDNYIPRAL
jgi:hypothetical protein